MTPIVNNQQKQYKQVISIAFSNDLETVQKFNIKATPTTVFLENNVVTNVELGSSSLNMNLKGWPIGLKLLAVCGICLTFVISLGLIIEELG